MAKMHMRGRPQKVGHVRPWGVQRIPSTAALPCRAAAAAAAKQGPAGAARQREAGYGAAGLL